MRSCGVAVAPWVPTLSEARTAPAAMGRKRGRRSTRGTAWGRLTSNWPAIRCDPTEREAHVFVLIARLKRAYLLYEEDRASFSLFRSADRSPFPLTLRYADGLWSVEHPTCTAEEWLQVSKFLKRPRLRADGQLAGTLGGDGNDSQRVFLKASDTISLPSVSSAESLSPAPPSEHGRMRAFSDSD